MRKQSKAERLMKLRELHIPKGLPTPSTPLFIKRAKGAKVIDINGRWFIDFGGGYGVLNVGHCDPGVCRAVKKQVGRYIHTDFCGIMYEPYILLAKKLNEITPGKFPKKTFFANSGAEAVENAVKIARAYRKAPGIICFEHAFHGRTYMALTLTYNEKHKKGFGPFIPEVHRIPYAYCYRCSLGGKCDTYCAEFLDEVLLNRIQPQKVAAVIVEPVVGEGGFIVPPLSFLRKLREICAAHDIVFIADEIQTGFARTGKLFACEHFGVEPDIIITAKSIAGGLVLSAITGRAEIMDSIERSGIGGTYGGNPLACAAALEVIKKINTKRFLKRAQEIGEIVERRFGKIYANCRFIGDTRGLGPMRALEFVKDRETKEPFPEFVELVSKKAYEKGLLLLSAGTYGNVIRTLMPLVITDRQLKRGLDILEESIKEVENEFKYCPLK